MRSSPGDTSCPPAGGEPVEERLVAPGEVEDGVEARQDALVGRESRVGGSVHLARIDSLVGVPEQRGFVPGAPRSECDVVEPRVERRPVRDHAVVHLVHPRVQRGATGCTGGGLAVVACEADATRGERVEIRRPNQPVAGTREAVATELVERDEQHVARTGHRRPTLLLDQEPSSEPSLPRRVGDLLRGRIGSWERTEAPEKRASSSVAE
jgi:hypothetical protein